MKRFCYIWLLGLTLLAGCLSTQPSNPSALANSAFRYYTTQSQASGDTVTAMLAYTAHGMARRDINTRDEAARFFEQMVTEMVAANRISENYPVKPNQQEFAVYRRFTQEWLVYARQVGIAGPGMPQEFANAAAQFIQQIMNRQYNPVP